MGAPAQPRPPTGLLREAADLTSKECVGDAPRTGVGYVPGLSISRIEESKTWMPGTRPGMAHR
jgi:hypothetical protein